jgi:hypothetical protein
VQLRQQARDRWRGALRRLLHVWWLDHCIGVCGIDDGPPRLRRPQLTQERFHTTRVLSELTISGDWLGGGKKDGYLTLMLVCILAVSLT